MKFLERLFPKGEPLHYTACDGLVITVKCPFCAEYIDVDQPDEMATGQKRGEGWCVWCGKRFIYYY
jgi:uncharacterized Zn-finger protein